MKPALYVTGIAPNGKKLLGGAFKMQDQFGFPIDSSFEEAKKYDALIDWLEEFADCWTNNCLKFESFIRQASEITGINMHERFSYFVRSILTTFPKMQNTMNPIDTACRYVLACKRSSYYKRGTAAWITK